MEHKIATGSTAVVFGLAEKLVKQLETALSQQGYSVHSLAFLSPGCSLDFIDQVNAELVFCGSQPEHYRPLLDAIQRSKPGLPLVVVSELPEVSEWLDTLEAGAADYCAPPFEASHIRWMVEGALKSRYYTA